MIIVSVLGLFGIFTFGFFISDSVFGLKSHILERISVGFLLGSGLFTVILFLMNWWFKIPFKLEYAALILLVLNTLVFAGNIIIKRLKGDRNLFKYNFNFKEGFGKLSGGEKVIVGVILFLFISSLIHNFYWPVKDWDALVLYDFRAKSFLATGFMADAISRGYFTAYPLYTSLFHTFLYLFNFSNPVFIYTLLYMCLVSLFYFVMLRITNNRLLSLFLALFISINATIYRHSLISYTNSPYTIFLGVGFAYLIYSFFEKGIKTNMVYLGVLFISLGSWVRVSEPFWLLAVPFILLFLIYSKKIIHVLGLLFILYIPRFLWFKFLSDYKVIGRSNDIGSLLSIKGVVLNFFSLNQIKIISYFYKNMISPYSILLIIFLISFTLLAYYFFRKETAKFKLKNSQPLFLFLPSILVFLCIAIMLLGIYIFMFIFGDYAFKIVDSAERSTMPLIPFLLFSIFVNIYYVFKFLTHKKNV